MNLADDCSKCYFFAQKFSATNAKISQKFCEWKPYYQGWLRVIERNSKCFFSRCPPTKDGLKEGTDREEKFMYIPDCQKDQEYTQYLSGYEEYLE